MYQLTVSRSRIIWATLNELWLAEGEHRVPDTGSQSDYQTVRQTEHSLASMLNIINTIMQFDARRTEVKTIRRHT